MIGETNINGGGGLNGKGALLKIKSQTGSTITVSKGSYSEIIKVSQLDPDNNFGSYWLFQTADFGEWTVTATLGTNTASDTVVIDNNKKYDIQLYFGVLYSYGDTQDYLTGGWVSGSSHPNHGSTGTTTWQPDRVTVINVFNGSWCIYTSNAINLTNFTSLKAIAYRVPNAGDKCSLVVSENFPAYSSVASITVDSSQMSADPNNPTTLTCDISALSGDYRIALTGLLSGLVYYKAWLE